MMLFCNSKELVAQLLTQSTITGLKLHLLTLAYKNRMMFWLNQTKHVSDVSISKKVDKTSPKLASAACDPEKSFTTATIALCGRCGPKALTVSVGGLPRYMEYKLTQVSIKSYSVNGGSGYATESLVLGFSEIEWRFTDGNITGKWSITDNKGS